MVEVVVRDCTIADIHRICHALRDADREEVEALGFRLRALLRHNFRGSYLRKAAFVDGEIAAVWGLYFEGLSDTGFPYLLTTKAVERVPVACVKEGKKAVAGMLRVCRHLEGYVAASYEQACRLLQVIGFELGEAEPMGPNGALFRKFTMSRVE